mmetsp:Transcript_733/g.1489  ORF Transcript_733/g.1489 Transcript_733/m.1489 type:complete len:129 (+) Transcript_733:218-604(+)
MKYGQPGSLSFSDMVSKVPKTRGPTPSVKLFTPLTAPSARPTMSGLTAEETKDEMLGYTKLPAIARNAHMNKCHGESATASKIHCNAKDTSPILMQRVSPSSGMAILTNTASDIIVESPSAAINSPSL